MFFLSQNICEYVCSILHQRKFYKSNVIAAFVIAIKHIILVFSILYVLLNK